MDRYVWDGVAEDPRARRMELGLRKGRETRACLIFGGFGVGARRAWPGCLAGKGAERARAVCGRKCGVRRGISLMDR